MDNTLAITLSAQNVLMRRMEVAANNMANLSTVGFKAESILLEQYAPKPASIIENPKTVDFVRDYTIVRDFRPGALQKTDNPLDLALAGDGFFTVQTPQGPAYTRDGQFTLDTNGRLITHDGKPVLDNGGQEINFSLDKGQPSISKTGIITQNGAQIAQLNIVTFEKPGALDKIGDNLLKATNQTPTPALNFDVVQGMVEASNVTPIQELTKIMEISRAFEQATRLQKQADELRSKALDKLSRV